MSGRGGCFKRRSPAANQAALVGSQREAEPRRAPRRALRSSSCPHSREQYRYVQPRRNFSGGGCPLPALLPPRPAPAPSPLCSACPGIFFLLLYFFCFLFLPPSFFIFF